MEKTCEWCFDPAEVVFRHECGHVDELAPGRICPSCGNLTIVLRWREWEEKYKSGGKDGKS